MRDGAVEAHVAWGEGQLGLELVVLVEEMSLELKARSTNREPVGGVPGLVIALEGVAKLAAKPSGKLEAVVLRSEGEPSSGVVSRVLQVDLVFPQDFGVIARAQVLSRA